MTIKVVRLLGVYSLTAIDQVHIIYLADMIKSEYSPGKESLEVDMFKQENIPWDDWHFQLYGGP